MCAKKENQLTQHERNASHAHIITITKPLISNKFEYIRNEIQYENIRS
jgi:hypothetical protein